MTPSFRGPVPTNLPSDLNMFASLKYWHDVPLIADDWRRALMGTNVRWDYICILHWVLTNFGRNGVKDPFKTGFEGSHEDAVVNASAMVDSAKGFNELCQDPVALETFYVVADQWDKYIDTLNHRRNEGNPLPTPKPPEPPKPAPTPVEPPKPEPKPEPAPVPSPGTSPAPAPKTDWKKYLAWASGILALAGTVTALTPWPIDDVIVKALKLIVAAFGG